MTNKLFTYVSDECIEEFLSYKSSYADVVAFLGSSGQIAARDNIYGFSYKDLAQVIDDESSYFQAASAKAVNDRISEVETVAAEALYDLNSQVQEMETVTANALYELNDRIENIDISEQLDGIYEILGGMNGNVSESIENLNSYISYIQEDIDEIDLATSHALYDLNSRVETIDMVAGKAILELYSYTNYLFGYTDKLFGALDEITAYCDISYEPVKTLEKVHSNYAYAAVIPIDSSENLADGGTLSDICIKPWLSESDKHLEISTGGILQESYFVTECTLVGQCTTDRLSMMNDNGTIKMWSMLPLDAALTAASQVLVRYYNENI